MPCIRCGRLLLIAWSALIAWPSFANAEPALDPGVRAEFERVLAEEREAGHAIDPGCGYRVDAALRSFVETKAPEGTRVRAEVVLLLSDARGGELRYVVAGHARTTGHAEASRVRATAMRAALRSALRAVPSRPATRSRSQA